MARHHPKEGLRMLKINNAKIIVLRREQQGFVLAQCLLGKHSLKFSYPVFRDHCSHGPKCQVGERGAIYVMLFLQIFRMKELWGEEGLNPGLNEGLGNQTIFPQEGSMCGSVIVKPIVW